MATTASSLRLKSERPNKKPRMGDEPWVRHVVGSPMQYLAFQFVKSIIIVIIIFSASGQVAAIDVRVALRRPDASVRT